LPGIRLPLSAAREWAEGQREAVSISGLKSHIAATEIRVNDLVLLVQQEIGPLGGINLVETSAKLIAMSL